MTCGPAMQISPVAPSGSTLAASSRIVITVEGIGSPAVPLYSKPFTIGLMQAPGEVSVRPYASSSGCPVIVFQRSATARCTAMPPPRLSLRALKSSSANPGVFMSALKSVFTAGKLWNLCFDSSLITAGRSRGFGIRISFPPVRIDSIMPTVNAKM